MLNRNLRIRFVTYFFTTMLVSTLIASTAIFLFINFQFDRQLSRSESEISQMLAQMAESDNPVISESLSIASYEIYGVHRVERGSALIEKYIERLNAGETIMEDHWLLPTVTTYFAHNGEYYQVSLFPTAGILMMTCVSVLTAVFAAIMLGTLISSFAGKRFLKPIRELCNATEEVAKGNFDVQVDVPRNMEMGKLCSNFNSMTHDLSRIEMLQKEFTSNVSHEFKTPLASIKGFATLLQKGELTEEERREYADIIVAESERLSKLSTSILRLTKLENTEILTDKTEFQLDEQIRQCIVLLAPQWSGKDIEINIEMDDAVINGNTELLQEVWVNLLTNAIKFTPKGGKIDVRLIDQLDTVQVDVEDNGCGMSEEVRERVFEKFYQGDSSHSGEGNGLGLALVKRIIQLCGGRIIVNSIPGDGSCFTVILPKD